MGVQYTRILRTYSGEVYDFSAEHDSYVQALASLAYTTDTRSRNNEFNIGQHADKITYLYEHAYMTYNFLGFRYIPDYNSFSEGDKSFSFNSENTYGVSSHAEGVETYSLGQYTHAEGYKTVAYAKYGHAEGNNTVVVGIGNHAEGNLTYVDGEYSHAEGVNNMSYDSYTHIEGHSNISYARTTHIEGYSNIAYSGYISHIEGFENNTYSSYAHTEGRANITYGNVSHVEGKENINFGHITHVEGHANVAIRDYAHVEGHHSYAYSDTGHNEGWYTYTGVAVDEIEKMSTNELPLKYNQVTHAEGIHTYAVASGSHSEGIETLASGLGSHAEGRDTKAIGYYSHAEGSYNVAYNDYSHAEGVNSYAGGEGSHAEGYSTAYGEYAHSEGDRTIANHDYTHAEGQNSQANGLASHAEGNSIANGEYSHSEGNGTTTNETASHAEGINTNALKQGSHAEGVSTYVYGIGGHAEGYYAYATASYTHAEGYATKASGLSAHAEGYKSNATSTYSHAEGSYTTASGIASHTEGSYTVVKTSYGHAEGYYTYVSGDSAHAEGVKTLASGIGSHAEGNQTVASNLYSHAEGHKTNAIGETSHAEGHYTYATSDYSHAEGDGSYAEGFASHAEGTCSYALQEASHAEGSYTHATADYSHAEGDGSYAEGQASHAEGYGTHAIGEASHAEGRYTYATADYSHAEGYDTHATNSGAHAEGTYTTAYADASHAEGQYSYSKGVASHAEGIGTYAYADGSHVVGKYNMPNNNAISIIGIGSGDNDRKNAVEILNNGNAYFMNVGGFNGTNINEATPLNKVIDNINTNIAGLVTAYDCMPKDYPWVPKDELNASYVGYISIGTTGNEHVTYFGLPFIYNYAYDSIAEGFGPQGPGQEGLQPITYGVNHAYGVRSHAEGIATNTYNRGEHAEGIRNFSTPDVTLHSVGFGDRTYCRNAIEITRTGYTYLYGIGEYYGYMNNDAEFVPKSLQEYLKETDEAWADSRNELASRIPSIEYTPYITAQYGKKIGTLTVIKGSGEGSTSTSYTIYGPKDTAGHIYNDKTDSLAEGSNVITYAANVANGSRSHAEGVGTNALGYASHTEGNLTYVYGDYGHAEGNKCIVNGNYGHAEGGNTIAGRFSHAEGDCTHAINTSHAEGVDTFAGNISHAEGDATFATGRSSHAEGVFSFATGNYSHSEGEGYLIDIFNDNTTPTWFYFSSYTLDTSSDNYDRITLNLSDTPSVTPTQAILNKTTVVYFTNATGGNTYVVPVNLSVLPTYTSSGNKFIISLPVGFASNQNIIAGMVRCKFAYGSNSAIGRGAHNEGCDTNAKGDYSHAEGWQTKTTSTGTGAHAEGMYTEASGKASHASGYGTVANLDYMTAIGYYNKEQSGAYKPALFDVGFGTATARNSIFTIFADDKTPGSDRRANVEIKGDLLATGKIDVTGNVSGANLPIVKRYDLISMTQGARLRDRLAIDGKNESNSICKIYVYNQTGSQINVLTELEAARSAGKLTINNKQLYTIKYSGMQTTNDWMLPSGGIIEFEITLMTIRRNNIVPVGIATIIGKWTL